MFSSPFRRYLQRVSGAVTVLATCALASLSAQAQTFSNTTPIIGPAPGARGNAAITASPYPSNITVSSLAGAVTYVTASAPEIDVRLPAGTSIPSGGTLDFGRVPFNVDKTITLTIANTGTDTLNISERTVSGLGFTLPSTPTTVAAGSSTTLPIRFNKGTRGPRSVQLTLGNNDSDESAYVINLTAVAVEAPSLVVNTTSDVVNDTDDLTSLREAINFANTDGGNSVISFDAAVFATPRTIVLNSTLGIGANGTLTINGPASTCTVSGNNAVRVFNITDANLTMNDLRIANGRDAGGLQDAAGINAINSALSLNRCVIADNTHPAGSYNNGGGLTILTSNGGASSLSMTDCTVSGNSSVGGGGIYANANTGDGSVSVQLSGCTFSNNSALLTNSGNAAGGQGGAIYLNQKCTATLVNCTFSNNRALYTGPVTTNGRGGAIYVRGAFEPSTLSATNCTIANNTANNGGGLFAEGPTNLVNTIVANNSAPTNPNLAGTLATNTNNLLTDDPGVATTLANNGGRTQTLALSINSRAVNAGTSGAGVPTVDQRGVARPQANRVDIGAYELQFTPSESLVVTTIADEDNGTSDARFGTGTSLREAINRANSDGVNSAITFDASAFAAPRKTITLSSLLPLLASNGTLSITAPAAGVVVSGNNTFQVFSVNSGANVTLAGLTISGGSARIGGGINNLGALLLDSCTLSGNSAIVGGAIVSQTNLSGVTLTIRNSTLSGNTATNAGGAIFNGEGLTVIDSSTIAGNEAPSGQGSGVASSGDFDTRTEVRNSIISGNTGTDVDFVAASLNSFQSNGFNLIGDGRATGAFNQTGDVTGNTDPGLAALADNGGRTQTRALLSTSPAVNTGNTTLGVDQRGVTRPQGPRPLGAPPEFPFGEDDKGAFELARPTGTLQFSSDYQGIFTEGAGPARITVTRTGGSVGVATATIVPSGSGATPGLDYDATPLNVTVTFADGDSAPKTINLPIVNDSEREGIESASLQLRAGLNTSLGAQTFTYFNIADDPNDLGGTIQFSAPTYTVNEDGTTNAAITVTRTGGLIPTSATIAPSAGSAPSATAGFDFDATPITVAFGFNDNAPKTIIVPIVNDTVDEANENILLTLSNPIQANLGPQATAVLTIIDNDEPPVGTFQFAPTAIDVNEAAGTVAFTVTRTGGSSGAVTVPFSTSNGTATSPGDFTATTGTVSFAAGETTKTFTVPIVNDTLDESNETFTVTLGTPTNGGTLGAASTATATIMDDDVAGSIQFGAATFSVNESGPTVTVTRTGGSSGAVDVPLSVTFGSAASADLGTLTPATMVTFADGDAVTKTITIEITEDAIVEGDETFTLDLGTPTNGATLGTQSTATVTILDNDEAPQSALTGALITELRYRGPGGDTDEFVEVRNMTNAPLDISGWQLLSGSPATLVARVPNGTVLLPRAHYLFTNTGYSLSFYASSDQTVSADLADGAAITLRNAVGGEVDVVSGLSPTVGAQTAQNSFVRLSLDGQFPDTGSPSDFLLVSTEGTSASTGSVQTTVRGAPGPQNTASPVARDDSFRSEFFDTNVAREARPNQVRVGAVGPPNAANPNGPQGTILFRRRLINTSSSTITRLRFRVQRLTTEGARTGTQADLRLLSSPSEDRVSSSQNGGAPVRVFGTQLEPPAIEGIGAQASGGLNASGASKNADGTVTVLLADPLEPGEARNYGFLFRVITPGDFIFQLSTETNP